MVDFLSDDAAMAFSLLGTTSDIAVQLRATIAVLGRVDVVVPVRNEERDLVAKQAAGQNAKQE